MLQQTDIRLGMQVERTNGGLEDRVCILQAASG